jgi:hypothetical protein
MARSGSNTPEDRSGHSSSGERVARAEIETCLSRPLTDAEWATQRNRLVEFVRILRRWDAAARKKGAASATPVKLTSLLHAQASGEPKTEANWDN